MRKIILGINNDFLRETYYQVFLEKGFEVLKTKSGEEVSGWMKTENPDAALIDVQLSEKGGFDILKENKEGKNGKKIPIIIFSDLEKKNERTRAMELEANGFIAAATTVPEETVRHVKIVLGEQKSYRLAINKKLHNAKEIIADFGYNYDLKCPSCGSDLVLNLIRDLSRGEDCFKVSFMCPDCLYSK